MLLSMLPIVALPAGLREQVLRLVDDVSPIAAGHRDLVARRAEPFDRSGFPKPVAAPRRVYGVQALTVAACVAAAAAMLLGAGTVFTLDALHHKGPAAASAATIGPAAVTQAPLTSGSERGVAVVRGPRSEWQRQQEPRPDHHGVRIAARPRSRRRVAVAPAARTRRPAGPRRRPARRRHRRRRLPARWRSRRTR